MPALDPQPQLPSQINMPNVDLIRTALPGPAGIELANWVRNITDALNAYIVRKGG